MITDILFEVGPFLAVKTFLEGSTTYHEEMKHTCVAQQLLLLAATSQNVPTGILPTWTLPTLNV